MQLRSIEIHFCRYAVSGVAFLALIAGSIPGQAGQPVVSAKQYGAVDPFDPSETVAHSLKDEVHLRLRLPAPDLPLSIVQTPRVTSPAPDTSQRSFTAEPESSIEIDAEPGILGKSLNTVMSLFDWSSDQNKNLESATPLAPEQSNEPIRINVHVGIKKPEKQTPSKIKSDEISQLQSPWERNQERVRRFFTFDEIKTHD